MSDQAKINHAAYLEIQNELEDNSMGKIALMHDGKVVEIYDESDDAYFDGCKQYGLGNFSIQVIGEKPASLGALSFQA